MNPSHNLSIKMTSIGMSVCSIDWSVQYLVKTMSCRLSTSTSYSDFFRFHDQWKFGSQKLVFVVGFIQFLRNRTLLNWDQTAAKLHMTTDRSKDILYLDLDDYLHGLIQLSNELVSEILNC